MEEKELEIKKTDWKNYRKLKKGETILSDDEVYDDDKKGWRKTICSGGLAPDPQYTAHRIYRRSIVACIMLIAIIFFGCGEPAKQKENIISAKRIDIHWFDENGYGSQEEFTIITIDSCEYLLAGYDRSRMITHKGNCKFCAERAIKNKF